MSSSTVLDRDVPTRAAVRAPADGGVATAVAPVLATLGDMPVRIEFWDGSAVGPADGPGTVHIRTPEAIKHILWAPGELGLGRAYVSGGVDVDGDVFDVLYSLR